MILPIRDYNGNRTAFRQTNGEPAAGQEQPKDEHPVDTLLKNNLSTRVGIEADKLTKAFTIYPAKGLKGSKNSNFYEFLTMGIVPYLIGSGMMITVFNGTNRLFQHDATVKAAKLGNKMALGVILYGIFKGLSKSLITYPVKWKTGIDTELPYAKVNYMLPENPDTYNETSIEYHKVGESVDFPRWDQLYGNPLKGETLNWRYDKIAKKNGLGTNLNDSDQEVKPIYKEVLVKSKMAKSFSSYLWAAVGVCLAVQKPMEQYLKAATLKFWHVKDFLGQFAVFGESFVDSWQSLYNGSLNKKANVLEKHAGKAVIAAAALSTVLGVLNSVHITKKPKNVEVIDKSKESTVC